MQFTTCLADGSLAYSLGCEGAALLETSIGRRAANTLSANTQATATMSGADSAGDVLCTSYMGGLLANGITVEFATGPTGAGNENLSLRVSVADKALLVEFATDGTGTSVTPTGGAVRDVINGDADAGALVTASCPGTGLSNSAVIAATNLAGGLDDGDYLRTLGNPNTVQRIARIEA